MVGRLKELEAAQLRHRPRLLLFSTGGREENLRLQLHSRIVLDERGAYRQSFGATGTPMAVLIDKDGRVASPVVAGAEQVLGLAMKDLATL